MAEEKDKYEAESQKERWVKYGSNVALTIVVVIVLASLIIYLAQKGNHIFNARHTGVTGLKPQTINLIKDLKSPIKIVSLYSEQGQSGETRRKRKRASNAGRRLRICSRTTSDTATRSTSTSSTPTRRRRRSMR